MKNEFWWVKLIPGGEWTICMIDADDSHVLWLFDVGVPIWRKDYLELRLSGPIQPPDAGAVSHTHQPK